MSEAKEEAVDRLYLLEYDNKPAEPFTSISEVCSAVDDAFTKHDMYLDEIFVSAVEKN